MNKKIIECTAIALIILSAGCATHGGISTNPIGSIAENVHAAVDLPPSDPMSSATHLIDPLTRELTSPSFIEHANKSLAMAAATPDGDPIFAQCITFKLALGQELVAKPLLSIPHLALPDVDLGCLLCVLEAKRQDLAFIQSGALAARIAEVTTRAHDIRKRWVIACGPLVMDELGAALPF